jgi:exodeoxyribonuclease-1
MAVNSFYWHDYETFGSDPRKDRPVQFAGIRTDFKFNILEEPLVVYCKPTEDYLPHPHACLITGITPQLAREKGVCEAEFIRLIHRQIAQANTCTVGYNNIRFDDEVTRNCLYRNFYDPYSREWQNGNSRWDLLDVVRAAAALRPEGIAWPLNDEGQPCFRLEQLAMANGIAHDAAHDALSDVYATIAFAKALSQAQPKLWQFLLQNRGKQQALDLLQLGQYKPVVHVSGKYPAVKQCLAIVLPICKHPVNNNGVIVYDLSINPEPMLSLSVQEIQARIFTATENLPEGVDRIPLKTVHINKCPVLAPLSVIRKVDENRLAIDLQLCQIHVETIKSTKSLAAKLSSVFAAPEQREQDYDPDLSIYSGGFFSEADKRAMAIVKDLQPEQLARKAFNFNDARLPEMLFRYRARNYPDALTVDEFARWQAFCRNRLTGIQSGAGITLADYVAILQQLKNEPGVNQTIIKALQNYGNELSEKLGLSFVPLQTPA